MPLPGQRCFKVLDQPRAYTVALTIGQDPDREQVPGRGCAIYGKTGAMLPIDDEGFLRDDEASLLQAGAERTGWFVGWVERPESAGGPVVFAHNLDLSLSGAMAARTRVAHDVLRANGVSIGED